MRSENEVPCLWYHVSLYRVPLRREGHTKCRIAKVDMPSHGLSDLRNWCTTPGIACKLPQPGPHAWYGVWTKLESLALVGLWVHAAAENRVEKQSEAAALY